MFEIRNTSNKGRGCFALVRLAAGQIVLEFVGKLLNEHQVDLMTLEDAALLLQIGSDRYLDLTGERTLYVNHSCNPNTVVIITENTVSLQAIRPIFAGEELTFDYSSTSTDTLDQWSMKCCCGEANCRKIISGKGVYGHEERSQKATEEKEARPS